jgi:uncharacterized protein YtpQ (UPF0354 family)
VKSDAVISRVIPQFFPQHWLERPGMLFSDFPSVIRIGYVIRDNDAHSYLMKDDLSSLGIRLEELHAAALANLAALPSASISIAKLPEGAEGWICASDDNFAAIRILLPEVQKEFCAALGTEFFLTIPCRDDCFCWSITQSAERQEKHAREALEIFQTDDYNLTPDIFHFSQSSFSVQRTQSV